MQSMVGAQTKERQQDTTLRRCLSKDCLKDSKRCSSGGLTTVFSKIWSNGLTVILFLHFAKAQTFLLGIKCSQHWAWYHKNTVAKKNADTVKINSFLGSGVFWILTVVNWREKIDFFFSFSCKVSWLSCLSFPKWNTLDGAHSKFSSPGTLLVCHPNAQPCTLELFGSKRLMIVWKLKSGQIFNR